MAIFMISLGWIVDADVEPAGRALARDADARQRGREQQQQAGERRAGRQPHQLLRRHLRDDEQHADGEQHVARRGRRSACRGRSRPSTSSPGRPARAGRRRGRAGRRSRSRSAAPAARARDVSKTALIAASQAPASAAGARLVSGSDADARRRRAGSTRASPRRRPSRPAAARRRSRAACRSAPSTGLAASPRCRPRSGTGPASTIVEHPARDRRRRWRRRSRRSRRSAASAMRRLLERREGGVERVVAVPLVDLGGVVLLVRLDRDHLRRAGLAAGLVGRAGERRAPPCPPASRRNSALWMTATCSGFQAQRRRLRER